MIKKLQDFSQSQYQRLDQPIDATNVTPTESSVRSKRTVFVFGTIAFTVGLLMVLFNSPYRNDFLAPGPLTSVHANLLNGEGADRCAACHEAGSHSLIAWAKDTVTGGSHLTECQSDLCMKCHDKTLPSEFALRAHGMNPTKLASVTQAQTQFKSASFDAGMIFNAPVNHDGEIACSACHREHHGAQFNLSALTDNQCQTCHQNVFHSFETDHPEFTSWPQVRRDRIAFDHATHFGKHFPARNSQFNCAQCHVDDDFQNVKKLASFEQACATCHNQQIVDSSTQGMQLIALPMLDVTAIEQAKLNVGQWPENATGDFDGPMPPLMRMLLSADPAADKLLEQLGTDFDFSDIDPDEPEQVRAAVDLVWHIKELLYELSLSGNDAIRSRLSKSVGREISPSDSRLLTQGLSQAVFQEATARWLPNLSAEVPLRRQGREDKSVAWMPSEQDVLFSIARVDDGELAPNPLKKLMGNSNRQSEAGVQSKPVVRTPQPLPEPAVRSNPSTSSNPDRPRAVVNRHLDNENNPDVLAANPLRGLLQGDANVPAPQVGKTPPVFPTPDQNEPSQGVQETSPRLADKGDVDSGNLVRITAPKILAVTANSGWFRDDLSLTISYRPVGHADQFLVSWTDFATSIVQANEKHEVKPLFNKLTSPTLGIGLCSSCHTVDRKQDNRFVANWKSQYRDPSIREFTKFAHGPHLLQQDCTDCHVLDVNTDKTQQFVGFDGGLTQSNFYPITKMSCAKCHAENQASNGCTTCHNYHVGGKVSDPKPLK